MLVLAGAGTGKTRVVTHRIAELVNRGTPPQRILAVTFTNKAANEMQQRAASILTRRSNEKPEISTFHSLCVRILRRNAKCLGYPPQFVIYDRGDQESLARRVLREIRVPNESLRPGDLINTISRWKSEGIRPQDSAAAARSDKEHLASMAFRRYQTALKAAAAVDFDDLLVLVEELFDRFAAARESESRRFAHLLVDEYQDTNGSQYRIVKALAAAHRNLCVVGDDDQSIYGWRGAEVSHILRFRQDWPEAKVVRLEENYRSTGAILEMANRLITFNKLRHVKVLRAARAGGEKPRILQCQDELDEARTVITDIQACLSGGSLEPRDVAILFRTNEQPRPFEAELRRAKLPYVLVGGLSFYDRKEVRDVLAYLKLLLNPDDEVALRRIINTPARGLGPRAVSALFDKALSAGKTVWQLLEPSSTFEDMSPQAVEAAHRFRALVDRYRHRLGKASLADVTSQLMTEIDYRQEVARLYPDIKEQDLRWQAVEEVVNAIGAYEKAARRPTLSGFLDEITAGDRSGSEETDAQLRRNAIALMTLHSAKGLEFPHVYLVGLEEGLLPHRHAVDLDGRAIDEERRLCYVGITRAQDRLTVSLALSRMKWGKARATVPSRFLFELIGKAEKAVHRPKGRTAQPRQPSQPQRSSTQLPRSGKPPGRSSHG